MRSIGIFVLLAILAPSSGAGQAHEAHIDIELRLDAEGCVIDGWPKLNPVLEEIMVRNRQQAEVYWTVKHQDADGNTTMLDRKQRLELVDLNTKATLSASDCDNHWGVSHSTKHFDDFTMPASAMSWHSVEPEGYQRSKGYWFFHGKSCYGYQVTALATADCTAQASDPRIIIKDGGGNTMRVFPALVAALLLLGGGVAWKKFRARQTE